MSVLTLVRHGQASVFAADYDVLSAVGEEQARALGDYWVRTGETIDTVYVGPRRRQRRTAELTGERLRNASRPWPEPVILEELDEYDLSGLLNGLAPDLARRDAAFAALVDAHRRSTEPERARSFQRMFESLLGHWQGLTKAIEDVEDWPAFNARVRRALDRMTGGVPACGSTGRGRRVAAFTSGGFIGTAAAIVLNAPDRTALELNWRLRNGSLTRLIYSPGRRALDDFNTVPHLTDPTLWTYR